MQEQKLKHLPNISVKNGISKSLAYEEDIKEYATKNIWEKVF